MTPTARPRRAVRRVSPGGSAGASALEALVLAALDEMKAVDIRHYDVRGQSDVADVMIIASGNSDRHVRAIAERTIERARASRRRPLGVEGLRDGEWVLVDLQDVVVHIMLARVREFYAIEQLWDAPAAPREPLSRPTRARSRIRRASAPSR